MQGRDTESDFGWPYPDSLDNDDIVIAESHDADEIIIDLTKLEDGRGGLHENMNPLASMWDEDFAASGSRFGLGESDR